MNKGISFYFGFASTPEQRAKMISEVGFDCVITTADERFEHQNGTIEEQVELFKKYNLKLSSLHNRYTNADLPNFYLDNEIGNKMEKNLIKDLEIAKKFGFNSVVLHLYGTPNQIGRDRLKRALEVAENLNVPIAVENIDCRPCFLDAFKSFKSPMLKFCYDSGHNNWVDPEIDYLTDFGDKLVCLHLHDNNGTADMHTLNKYGCINWNKIAQKLAKANEVNLDYELLMNYRQNETMEEVLRETFKEAQELEEMIKKYKNYK